MGANTHQDTAKEITAEEVKHIARDCGFELAGVTAALPHEDFSRFEHWRSSGYAGEMTYLTDRRGDLRADPRNLLASAKSIICVGKLYNADRPTTQADPEEGWVSRYAWGADYHGIMREGLTGLVRRLTEIRGAPFDFKICVDTAPLLERSYARAAGLGWIGKNACLINQQRGSWFFLGEVLVSIALAPDCPPPDRCGSCRRCIEACPTKAIVPDGGGGWTLDSRVCISYLTIEKRGDVPDSIGSEFGNLIFGCDICQDVCPWNRRAEVTEDIRFFPIDISHNLEWLSNLTESEFRTMFRDSPVWRAKYEGFLRNVSTALGNSGNRQMVQPLERLACHPASVIANAARRALSILLAHREQPCVSAGSVT